MMWRGKDVMYNVLGYLVFAIPSEMPFIAYREPQGGPLLPPRTPLDGRGQPHPPPSTPPPVVCTYQACELLAKTPGVGVVVTTC